MKKGKTINNVKHYKKYSKKDITPVINRRYKVLLFIIIGVFIALTGSLYYVQIISNAYYKNQLEQLTRIIVEGSSTPRGRIYDRKGRIIVDISGYRAKRKTSITHHLS